MARMFSIPCRYLFRINLQRFTFAILGLFHASRSQGMTPNHDHASQLSWDVVKCCNCKISSGFQSPRSWCTAWWYIRYLCRHWLGSRCFEGACRGKIGVVGHRSIIIYVAASAWLTLAEWLLQMDEMFLCPRIWNLELWSKECFLIAYL